MAQARIAKSYGGASMSLQGQHDLPGVPVGVRKAGERGGSRNRTKPGMFMKINDMRICDRPIEDLGNAAVGDFAARESGETKQTQAV